MTTADWALIISLGSILIAFFSLLWNVWSKFIYPKSKVRVNIQTMTVIHQSGKKGINCICISATNHGPTEITLYNAIAKGEKRTRSSLNPLENFPHDTANSNGPFSGGLPKKLAVGEQFSAYFPRKITWFEEKMVSFGFSDTFGRDHWCPKKQVQFVKKTLLAEQNDENH